MSRAARGELQSFRRAPLGLAALVCGVVFVAAGCGGNSSTTLPASITNTGSSTTPTSTQDVIVQASKGAFSPEAVYRQAAPGVVTILAISDGGGASSILGRGGGGQTAGQGSGFVISKDGEVVTNAHVVTTGGVAAGGGPVKLAKQIFVEFPDHNRVPAKIVGVDPDADVALIKVDPSGIKMAPVSLSDGSGITVGAPVAAIGSPFGEEQSLSVGVISATDRTIPSLTKFSIDGAIQTDASINPGNSGGPLLNSRAQVIGINQQIESQSGSNAGVGFAVPISAVRYSVTQLRESGRVQYSFIGVSTQTLWPQLAQHLGIPAKSGALVSDVVPGSPAQKAGLRAGNNETRFQGQTVKTGGDLIVALDGHPVNSSSDVATLIANKRPGEQVTLDVIRGGSHQTVNLTLGARPEKPPG